MRNSKTISRLERLHAKPLREIVIESLQSEGTLSAAARKLGVPISTYYFWIIKFGIRTKTITQIAS